jgi:hypothetical protein
MSSWKSLLRKDDERVVLPWTGGRSLPSRGPEYRIDGRLPPEHGWHEFRVDVRRAFWVGAAPPETECLVGRLTGYFVGDRIVPDGARVDPDPAHVLGFSEAVHLLEPGLSRFARASAGRVRPGAPLVFLSEEMPVGPEDLVLRAYQDRLRSVSGIKDVTPALDAAFRLESWQRDEVERRRAEIEAQRAAEEAAMAEEERRARLRERLSDGAGRRAMAMVDFGQAASAALLVTGAEYLDHRASTNRGEMVVTFRVEGRRFECVCDQRTLRIVDAGICLVDHRTREAGDARFTLESLPEVIRQATRERVLHVLRHVGADEEETEDDWD